MSIAIDPRYVTNVLIGDKWYDVMRGTFAIDAYEYIVGYPNPKFQVVYSPKENEPNTGFEFETIDGLTMAGPVTAIQAVKFDRRESE